MREKIWNKCDPSNDGKIHNDQFHNLWRYPTYFYKHAMHEKYVDKNTKPTIDEEELRKEVKHLVFWIIMHYGDKQDDGWYTFTLKKEQYEEKLIKYLKQYVKVKGAIQ